MRITVQTLGPPIRGLRAQLYTFSGARLGTGRLRGTLRGVAQLTVRLRFPAQAGRFSLIVTALAPGGYTVFLRGKLDQPASCGPKTASEVLSFH